VASSRLRGEDLLGYHLILLVVDLQTYLVGIAVGALSIFSMFHRSFVCTESPILDVSTTSTLCFFLVAMGLVDSMVRTNCRNSFSGTENVLYNLTVRNMTCSKPQRVKIARNIASAF
jgi:hypothetical protein